MHSQVRVIILKPTLQVASLETSLSETGFSVDTQNRFLKQLKKVPVYSVDRPLVFIISSGKLNIILQIVFTFMVINCVHWMSYVYVRIHVHIYNVLPIITYKHQQYIMYIYSQ